jgi:hypothetical protein
MAVANVAIHVLVVAANVMEIIVPLRVHPVVAMVVVISAVVMAVLMPVELTAVVIHAALTVVLVALAAPVAPGDAMTLAADAVAVQDVPAVALLAAMLVPDVKTCVKGDAAAAAAAAADA